MNIFKKAPANEKYVGPFRRSAAATIDLWIVLILRVIVMQILGTIWLNQAISNFLEDFKNQFGTETVKNTPEHIDFIIHHRIFIYALMFYAIIILVGAAYHAYLNSSSWRGTIGKRLMKMVITTENDLQISFNRGMMHYFLSVLPFAYLIFLISFQVRNNLTFYQAITASQTNIFFGIVFLIWIQIHLFTKKRTTAYDMICNTIVVSGRVVAKWPWTKVNPASER